MNSLAEVEKALSEASRALKMAQWDLKIFLCDSHSQPTNSPELERLQAVSNQQKARVEQIERKLAEFHPA